METETTHRGSRGPHGWPYWKAARELFSTCPSPALHATARQERLKQKLGDRASRKRHLPQKLAAHRDGFVLPGAALESVAGRTSIGRSPGPMRKQTRPHTIPWTASSQAKHAVLQAPQIPGSRNGAWEEAKSEAGSPG